MSMEAGSWLWNFGTSFLTASTTATVLVPGWRSTASTMDRSSLYHPAILSFSTESSTLPSSSSRTGAPFRYATTSGRYPEAWRICPLVSSVKARSGPQRVPVGRLTLAARTAATTSSIPICRSASTSGSSWTRTAYFCAP